jgi:hypothetical protein
MTAIMVRYAKFKRIDHTGKKLNRVKNEGRKNYCILLS